MLIRISEIRLEDEGGLRLARGRKKWFRFDMLFEKRVRGWNMSVRGTWKLSGRRKGTVKVSGRRRGAGKVSER